MNKLSRLFRGILLSAAIIFSACTPNVTVKPSATVTKIDGSKTNEWNFVTINLGEYNEQRITIDFSTDMLVENANENSQNLMWQVSTGSDYPTIASKEFENGLSDWETVSGSEEVAIESADAYFYLNANGIDYTDLTIYLDNFSLVITAEDGSTKTYKASDLNANDGVLSQVDKKKVGASDWLADKVPSLYETYKDQFDYIGIAAEYGNFGLACSGDKYTGTYTHSGWGTPSELYYEEIQKGVAKHANSITLGNELKPQFLLQWWDGKSNNTYVEFTASNGKTIKVPSKLNGESLIYATLNACKKMGVQMRGHVLTWHSQTPDGFFAENYTPTYNGELISNIVDKETMTARHEWYIKTVLKCVADWEAANNYKAIWAWDVVNEAMADDAGKTYTGTSQDWLRGSTAGTKDKSPNNGGSRWYQVYGNEEFIINAFRFANKYAPADVKLCYNDYNEYMDYHDSEKNKDCYKTSAIEHIANLIKADSDTRFDVIAMQSHVGTSWPGVNGYETALKRFLAIADVHVSELDFSAETQAEAITAYKDYFTMLQKYGKNYSGTHKIRNVTIWGINNESSWINPSAAGGKKTYPLLFNLVNNVDVNKKDVTYNTGAAVLPQYDIGDTYEPNDAFWAVINAHK